MLPPPHLMFAQFRQRSLELERLDTGDYTAEEYEGCIVELQRVNRWLGDASAVRESLLREIDEVDLSCFSVLDVGAGSGELLSVIAEWARRNGRIAQLTGVELNARSAKAIAERALIFPEINALRGDAFRLPFPDNEFDYTMCSLFTHHFRNAEVTAILRELGRVATRGVFVIDLHRHPVAYFFYTTIGRLFLHNPLIREDGALSILRSFRPEELASLAEKAELKDISVTRRFPYRLVLAASPPNVVERSGVSERSRYGIDDATAQTAAAGMAFKQFRVQPLGCYRYGRRKLKQDLAKGVSKELGKAAFDA